MQIERLLLDGVLSGMAFFALLTVSDAIFYHRRPLAPVLRPMKRAVRRYLLLCALAVVDGVIVTFAYALFWQGTGWFLKGLTLGLLCGLVLMRPQMEAFLFFRRDLVPAVHIAYWAAEYFLGYTVLGVIVAFFQEYLNGTIL